MTIYEHKCLKCAENFQSQHKRQKFCSVSCSSHRRGDLCKNGHKMTEENTYLYKGYSVCKVCRRNNRRKWQYNNPEAVKKQTKKWRAENTEQAKANARSYYQANKDKVKKQAKKWRENNPNKSRNIRLRKYGITGKDYDSMLDAQGGLYAICTRISDKKVLHVDHDHKTCEIRGLLCINCNVALGLFQDNPELLRKAAFYVENSSIKEVKT